MNSTRLEMIGSAAAGIAHDINNQLHLIVNHLALSDLQAAQRATERCSALTASLLAYCKGEPIEVTSTNPAAFLRSFATQLRLPVGVDLDLRIPALLPPITADPLALTRDLTNLISNACEAMDCKGTLRITASPRAIEVSDTGSGIPAEVARRIFDPFFTTKGTNGTGLGLSIVRELMRQQGGSVTLRSEPGRGARFTLHFR
jgi:two-component system cell cycle sensor histidine kinase/response regulator CckA